MTNQVKVIAGQDGQLLQQSTTSEDTLFFRVEKEGGVSFTNGFARTAVSARINVDKTNVNLVNAVKNSIKVGMLIPGKIVVKETRTPQWEGHTVCINPTTNAPALRNGSPYYRSAKYTENINEMDELISSDASVVAAPTIQLGFPQRQF